jgi:hypothetical protein
MREFDIDTITAHAITALLWSTPDYDENGNASENLDANYDQDTIDPEEVAEIRNYVAEFVAGNAADLDATGATDEQIGHDFTLTANGHGAGFWDRGYDKAVGDRLTDSAESYGEVNAWAENGQVHVGM